jgi:hypothetical protein
MNCGFGCVCYCYVRFFSPCKICFPRILHFVFLLDGFGFMCAAYILEDFLILLFSCLIELTSQVVLSKSHIGKVRVNI